MPTGDYCLCHCKGISVVEHERHVLFDGAELQKERNRLRAERDKLKSELEELHGKAAEIMSEPCNGEVHCSCVPALRAELDDIASTLDAINEQLFGRTPATSRAKQIQDIAKYGGA